MTDAMEKPPTLRVKSVAAWDHPLFHRILRWNPASTTEMIAGRKKLDPKWIALSSL